LECKKAADQWRDSNYQFLVSPVMQLRCDTDKDEKKAYNMDLCMGNQQEIRLMYAITESDEDKNGPLFLITHTKTNGPLEEYLVDAFRLTPDHQVIPLTGEQLRAERKKRDFKFKPQSDSEKKQN
jgi:hypothetical protein